MEDYSDTIITFNQFLIDKNYHRDRESLSIEVTEMLYELLNTWSDANNTVEAWEKAASKDFGDVIFIHADDAITSVHLEILINKDGIHLEMGIACPEKLQFMPDNFWMQFVGLHRFGNFTVIDTEGFSDEDELQYPALKDKNTAIFSG